MLLRVNVFNMYRRFLKNKKNRQLPFYIKTGFIETDVFTVTIPKNYKIDRFPKQKIINNKFGDYKVVLTKTGDRTLKFSRKLYLKEGAYTKEEYNTYSDFIRSIRKYDNLKIALKRI